MRLGPILVPSAIVVAIGVLVAAQEGWLDTSGPESTFVMRGDPAIHGTATPMQRLAASTVLSTSGVVVVAGAEPTSIGRSVGKNGGDAHPSLATSARGSGGASLDSDGAGSTAAASTNSSSPADALQQARDDASKAKQDLLEVTQASVAAQSSSEAEFERQKAELNEQIAQLRAKIDAAQAQPAGSDATAEAEAKAATATAELADARQRENALRTKLAAVQSGVGNDKAGGTERALAEAQGRAKSLEDKLVALQTDVEANRSAADKLAVTDRARTESQGRVKALEDKMAALQAEAAASKSASDQSLASERADAATKARIASEKVAALESEVASKAVAADKGMAAEQALSDARARTTLLTDRMVALEADLTASHSAATQVAKKAEDADRLKADLDAARQQTDTLNRQVATMQANADASARAKTGMEAAAVHDVAALRQQLEDSRLREQELGTKLAEVQAGVGDADARAKQVEAAASKVAAMQQQLATSQGHEKELGVKLAALQSERDTRTGDNNGATNGRSVALQDDLAGARRGEDTLRRENGILQRELAQERTSNKLIGEKLAALQVGTGQPVPLAADGPRRGRTRAEHERLSRQLDGLQREQMHQEVQALKSEEADISRARRGRTSPALYTTGQSANSVTLQPMPDARLSRAERHAARRRDRQALRGRDTPLEQPPVTDASKRYTDLRQLAGKADDSGVAIAQATGLIRSGNIDQARALLRQRGGASATRALADTYNPLTNTQYGVIGVDSDADKASYLYQQAARSAR